MIGSTGNLAVNAAPHPVDLRRGFEGLFAFARDVICRDPLSGHLFLFVARNRRSAKVLVWDGTGLCIFHKRLAQGRFVAPWSRDSLEMTQSELALFLEGSRRVRETLSPAEFRVDSAPRRDRPLLQAFVWSTLTAKADRTSCGKSLSFSRMKLRVCAGSFASV